MRSLDDVLSGSPAGDEGQHEQAPDLAPVTPTEPSEPTDQPQGDQPADTPPANGAPPAPENDDEDKPLPAHVVKAIRGERNDWKERAIRAEAEAKAIRDMQQQRQQAAPQGDVQQVEVSPQEMFEQRLFIERSNMSQLMAKQAYPDLDEKVEQFVEHAKGNPALIAEMKAHPHPFEFAYKKALQLQTLAEIGDDPVAYRERMREQLRAELASQPTAPAAATAPRAPLPPASLAGARSAAPRSAAAWTGPTPLTDIVRRG